MQPLIFYINSNDELSRGLQAIHFLSSTVGELVLTLIYDRDIECGGIWYNEASQMRSRLLLDISLQNSEFATKISIIGRSKGQKLVIGCNYVMEHLVLVKDGRTLIYKQVDDGFSNPNARVNMKALDWICHSVKETISNDCHSVDLLEMYCGNGNHTVALSGK